MHGGSLQKKKKQQIKARDLGNLAELKKKRWEKINSLILSDQTCTAAIYTFSLVFYAETLCIKTQNGSGVFSGL